MNDEHPHVEIYDEIYQSDKKYRMKVWRQDAIRSYFRWKAGKDEAVTSYLDVGCGRAESVMIAKEEGVHIFRGCEVAKCRTNQAGGVHKGMAEYFVDFIPKGARFLDEYYQPETYDVVSAMDVPEHFQRDEWPLALRHMYKIAKKAVLIGVPCTPANDRERANIHRRLQLRRKQNSLHIIQETKAWWLEQCRDVAPDAYPLPANVPKIPPVKEPYIYIELPK